MNENDMTSLRLCIEGSVQGVGYRHFAMGEARKLALDGWIRNRMDGTVEILVSGPDEAVETFVGLCMRGPPSARITNVDLYRAEPPREKGFRRVPTE